MTDKEKFCNKRCANKPCKHICDSVNSYLYGLERGRKELEEENQRLKKNALVWHKVTCFDKPDENGCITDDNPSELEKQYLIRLKRGDFVIQELTEACDYGFVLEDYEWEDVDAWAELPEV